MNSIVMPMRSAIVRTDTCQRCKHAAPQGNGLECHRNPPMAAFMPGPGGQPVTISAFPPVPKDGFCGEFGRKIEAA